MRVWRKKIFWVSILIIIMVVTLTLLLLYFHGKSIKEAEPEEWHMIDDGVYFNVYTEDTKGQETTGIFENITSDTVFYASIQNSGQERYVKLACYLNYERVSIEMLNSSYDNDQILLEDKDNITIPFKLKGEIDPDKNYKLLVSLFLGTNLHESDTKYEATQHTLSYDYYLKNREDSAISLNVPQDSSTELINYDFPGFVLNTDYLSTSDGIKLPPSEVKAAPGESFKLAYRIGQIGDAHQQLMLVTIDYQQANINGERSLMIETEEGHTSFGIITLKAPETKGKYEICSLLVPSPESSNEFTFLENAYRFTLTVE